MSHFLAPLQNAPPLPPPEKNLPTLPYVLPVTGTCLSYPCLLKIMPGLRISVIFMDPDPNFHFDGSRSGTVSSEIFQQQQK